MRRASLALLLALAIASASHAQNLLDELPATIPGYDSRFGLPLLARAETRLRSLGIDLAGLDLAPSLDIGTGFDSNPRGARPARGSAFVTTAASLGLLHQASGATIAGQLRAEDRRSLDMPSQSRTNWSAALGTAAEIGGGRLSIAASHLALHQDRTDLDSIASDRPIPFTADNARISYSYRFNRLTLTPNAEFTLYRFSATTIAGIPISQLYRDRAVSCAGLGGRYELAPRHGLLFALGAAATRYQHPAIGEPSRNSTDALALVGMDSGNADPRANPWSYSILLGAQSRFFADSTLATRIEPVADAQLHWQPTGLTGATLRLTRSIEDAARPGQASATISRARLTVEHEYARDLIFQLTGGAQLAEYDQGRTGISTTAGARVIWLVNNYLRATLSYDFSRWREGLLDSSPADSARLRNLVMLRLRFSP